MSLIGRLAAKNRKNLLSLEQTNALIDKAHAGDLQARNQVVENNVGLVLRVVGHKPWLNTPDRQEEAFQNGIIGMMRAVDLFEPSRGFAFSTYANWWIEQSIRRHEDDDSHLLRLPVHILDVQRRYNMVRNQYPGREEDFLFALVAFDMNKTVASVRRAVYSTRPMVNIHAENEDGETYIDVEAAPDTDLKSYDLADIDYLLSRVDERSATILRLRSQKWTLEEVGYELQITRERVRQIETQALKKLKKLVNLSPTMCKTQKENGHAHTNGKTKHH